MRVRIIAIIYSIAIYMQHFDTFHFAKRIELSFYRSYMSNVYIALALVRYFT